MNRMQFICIGCHSFKHRQRARIHTHIRTTRTTRSVWLKIFSIINVAKMHRRYKYSTRRNSKSIDHKSKKANRRARARTPVSKCDKWLHFCLMWKIVNDDACPALSTQTKRTSILCVHRLGIIAGIKEIFVHRQLLKYGNRLFIWIDSWAAHRITVTANVRQWQTW